MSPERRAAIFLLLTTAIWGATFFSMQRAVTGISPSPLAPFLLLALRFSIAAAAFALIFPGVLRRMDRSAWVNSFALAVPFYVGFILQIWGLQGSTPTVVAFLTNLTVVLTPAIGAVFFREKFAAPVLLGAAIAFAGVYVLTDPGGGSFGRAEVFALLCSVAFAFQIQLTNVATRRSEPEAVTLGLFVWAVLFSLAGLALFAEGRALLAPAVVARVMSTRETLWMILFNALLASVVAIGVMNRFQRDLPATRAAVIYTLEPVFAAAFSAWYIGEPMTPRKLAGGGIIIAGNVLCEILRRRSAASGSLS